VVGGDFIWVGLSPFSGFFVLGGALFWCQVGSEFFFVGFDFVFVGEVVGSVVCCFVGELFWCEVFGMECVIGLVVFLVVCENFLSVLGSPFQVAG